MSANALSNDTLVKSFVVMDLWKAKMLSALTVKIIPPVRTIAEVTARIALAPLLLHLRIRVSIFYS
jgi:hypothetical protein